MFSFGAIAAALADTSLELASYIAGGINAWATQVDPTVPRY